LFAYFFGCLHQLDCHFADQVLSQLFRLLFLQSIQADALNIASGHVARIGCQASFIRFGDIGVVQIEQALQAQLQRIDLLRICQARLVKHLEDILDVVFEG